MGLAVNAIGILYLRNALKMLLQVLKFENGKISLSMKEVDQDTGEDLNPREPSLPKDSVLAWEDMPRNPEAPWINPSGSGSYEEENKIQAKRYAVLSIFAADVEGVTENHLSCIV